MLVKLNIIITTILIFALGAVLLLHWDYRAPLDQAAYAALYDDPAPAPIGPQSLYFIGHSLVGQDMPFILAELSGADVSGYESQLGWGATLKSHWEPDLPIKGFEIENAHPRYRDAREAVASGEYDVVILTEMVEIRDAIKYFNSSYYLHRFAREAWEANPNTRVYLYETWHSLDNPEGWLERLDQDLTIYWETEIVRKALAYKGMERPIYIIPAGQVMARLVREIEGGYGVPGLETRRDLFHDDIHLSKTGLYLVALIHYSVIHQRSPVGLPNVINLADSSSIVAVNAKAALLMQEIVWQVVSSFPKTGIR